jgi:hypothetical protein
MILFSGNFYHHLDPSDPFYHSLLDDYVIPDSEGYELPIQIPTRKTNTPPTIT